MYYFWHFVVKTCFFWGVWLGWRHHYLWTSHHYNDIQRKESRSWLWWPSSLCFNSLELECTQGLDFLSLIYFQTWISPNDKAKIWKGPQWRHVGYSNTLSCNRQAMSFINWQMQIWRFTVVCSVFFETMTSCHISY